jgi:hypothetical protein
MQLSINKERVTWEITDGEAVVVHFETSAYYALNSSGAYIWSLLAGEGAGIDELTHKVAAFYGKVPGEIAAEIAAFLENLRAEDLVTDRTAGPGAEVYAPEQFVRNGDYQPPKLTRFGELEKLILSGE